ncbi:MAG: 7TM diverse intracellular signaling domain-containing protein [Bacteroidota bacterium]
MGIPVTLFSKIFIYSLLIVWTSSSLYAQRIITLTDSISEYSIGAYTDILRDSKGNLTIDSVAFGDASRRFAQSNSLTTNFGHTTDIIWLRFTVRNNALNTSEWLISEEYSAIDNVTFYFPTAENTFVESKAGLMYPMSVREFPHRLIVFPFRLSSLEQKTFFIRFESQLSLPLYLRIWKPESFSKNEANRNLFYGLFYGALLIMAFYNLFLYFSIKDLTYLYYFLYAISVGYYQWCTDGFNNQFIMMNNPWLNFRIYFSSVIFAALFWMFFVREFLQIQKYSTIVNSFYKVMSSIFILLAVMAYIPFFTSIVAIVNAPLWIGIFFLNILSGFYCLIKGNKNARIYLIATIIFVFGAMFRALRVIGIQEESLLTESSMQIGILVEMTILSFALGNRINTLREEKEKEKHRIRTQIAQDLHDDVSATISSIYFDSEVIKRSEKHISEKGKEKLEKMITNLQNAKERLNDIVWSLHSQKETWESLLSKCRRFAEDMFENKKIEYTIEIPQHINAELTAEQKDHLWLVFKEIITNVCRHSQATKAGVTIWEKDKFFHCLIFDNGVGFTLESVQRKSGVTNIFKRAEALRGKATLHSTPNALTTWIVEIPLV